MVTGSGRTPHLIIAAGLCVYLLHLRQSNMTGFVTLPADCPRCNWVIDGYGHEAYIRRIARRSRIPSPGDCWECHQPPLYYLFAGTAYRIASAFPSIDPMAAVRVLSVGIAVCFLIFAERLLRMEITRPSAYVVALCLLTFWPLQAVLASRIGNDPAFYLADAGMLYYILRWQRDQQPRSLGMAVLWCAIGFAVKYTAVISVGFAATVIGVEWYRRPLRARQIFARPVLIALSVAAMLVVPTIVRTYSYFRVENKTSVPLLVPTVPGLVQSMGVSNDRIEYFLAPHVSDYAASPFLGQGAMHPELRYFVNYVMKTSLFGFVVWRPVRLAFVLTALQWSLFAYVLLSAVLFAVRDRSFFARGWPLMLFAASHVLALVAYRLVYPHVRNQDFRFVYSVVIAMAALHGMAMSSYRTAGRRYLFACGMALTGAFVAASTAFILVSDLAGVAD